MKLPPLNGLRAFEAAARYESFVKAAAELCLTSAAVSQHVRALEQALGVQLFTRHPRGVTLTGAGRDFGAAATHGLTHIALAAERLETRGRGRPISLACIASVTTRWLIPRLPEFRADHPDIRINVVYALDAQTAEAAGADLLIRHGFPPKTGAIKLFGGETRPTCSPGFRDLHGPFSTPRDLLGVELLHDATDTAWMHWFAEAGFSMPPRGGLMFADFNLLIGSVIGGQGVGLCPSALIADELQQGSLITLFDMPSDQAKAYWLMEAGGLSPEAATLRDWLVAASR